MPLGSETFDLMVSAAYSPERAIGQKVEVRGFLIRRPTLSRINITSLETLQLFRHRSCNRAIPATSPNDPLSGPGSVAPMHRRVLR